MLKKISIFLRTTILCTNLSAKDGNISLESLNESLNTFSYCVNEKIKESLKDNIINLNGEFHNLNTLTERYSFSADNFTYFINNENICRKEFIYSLNILERLEVPDEDIEDFITNYVKYVVSTELNNNLNKKYLIQTKNEKLLKVIEEKYEYFKPDYEMFDKEIKLKCSDGENDEHESSIDETFLIE